MHKSWPASIVIDRGRLPASPVGFWRAKGLRWSIFGLPHVPAGRPRCYHVTVRVNNPSIASG